MYFLSDKSVLCRGWGGRGAAGRRGACEVGPEGQRAGHLQWVPQNCLELGEYFSMESSTNETVFFSIVSGGSTFQQMRTNAFRPHGPGWPCSAGRGWASASVSPSVTPGALPHTITGRSPQVSTREVLGTATGR